MTSRASSLLSAAGAYVIYWAAGSGGLIPGFAQGQEAGEDVWRETAEALSEELATIAKLAATAESERSALERELEVRRRRVRELEREAVAGNERQQARLDSEGTVREALWISVQRWREEAAQWKRRYDAANGVVQQQAAGREEAESRIGGLAMELGRLAEELGLRDQRLGDMERVLGETARRADLAAEEVEGLRGKLDTERKAFAMERSGWAEEREELRARLAESREAASRTGEVLAVQAAAMNRLVTVREAADRERDATAQTIDVLKGRLMEQLEWEAEEAERIRRAENWEKETAAMRTERDAIQESLRKVEQERDGLARTAEDLREKTAGLQAEVEELKGVEQERSDLAEAAVALREEKAGLQAQVEELKAIEQERDGLAESVVDLREEQAGLQARVEELQAVAEERDGLERELAASRETLTGLVKTRMEFEDARTEWTSKEAKWRSARSGLEQELSSSRRDEDARRQELEELRSALSMLRGELGEAAGKWNDHEASVAEFRLLLEMTEAEARRLRGIVLRIEPVRYGLNDASISHQKLRLLTQVRDVLDATPGARFRLCGHTCDVGSEEANLELSRRRAESLMRYLVSEGVPEDRLEAEGFGEERPAGPNDSEEARSRNRRVEVEVVAGKS
ncbi:MAG TPA: OmpA family protein [Verrucomicrobiales bacterium]|nr:OmpA family protein [Verrucomicrobiales bacterium]